tara:strand:+ start:33 stop:371 length:339 start_codon:yes stop_codon:yes gene_type:complete
MKKIILVLSLLISSLTFAQQEFEGVWQHKENKDDILIIYVEDINIQFYNYKLNEEFHLNEVVEDVSDDHIHTVYEDILNDYTYELYYYLVNKNTLVRKSQQLKTEIIYKKID